VVKRAELKKAILESMTKTGRDEKASGACFYSCQVHWGSHCWSPSQLKGFEIVKDVYVCAEPFSVENDLLTPTFKLRRPQAHEKFKPQIEAMYKNLD
jgi:long-subunit acyl-CoA synthetase (AMP-forming)